MDYIIRVYLKNFVEDLELNKEEKESNFEMLCHYAILKNELLYLDVTDLSEIGVGKNTGIDGICFSIDGRIVKTLQEIEDLKVENRYFDATLYFVQATISPKFENSKITVFCDTVIDFLQENPKYRLTPEAQECHDMYVELLKLRPVIKSFNCKMFYCTTGNWNDDATCTTTIDKKREKLKSTHIFKGDVIDIIPVDKEKLIKLYDKASQPFKAEFTFSNKTSLNEIENVKESYIGILPFSEYKRIIIDKDTGKLRPLFYDNVRDFLGIDADVNNKINETIQNKDFDMFQLLNNGITIIADENKQRGDKFILTNSQIVNGCQTSNILFLNRDLPGIDNLFIPVKLIITENQEIRDRLIISSNNQTKIKEEQLLALTFFQRQLEGCYKYMGDGLSYERRTSQYSSDPSIKKKSIINIREQIKSYVAMFLEEPHVVSGYFGKVYKDRTNNIFNKDHSLEPYYLSAFTQFTFKQLLNSKKLERKYNKARYHIIMLFRKIAEPSLKLDPADKKNTNYCNAILTILRKQQKALKYFKNAIELVNSSGIDIDNQKEIYKKSTTNALIEVFNEKYK